MKKTIFFKLFSSIFLIIFSLSSLIFLFSFNTIKLHYLNTLSYELRNFTYVLNLAVTPLIDENKTKCLDSLVKKTGEKTNTRITVISPDGTVLADSKEDPKTMENHRGRPEIRSAIHNGFGRSIRYSTTVKQDMLYVAIPLKSGDRLIGVLRVSLFLSDINSLLNKLKSKMLYSVLIITILSIFAVFLFSKKLSDPIKKLAIASKNSAEGNFDTKLELGRNDELGELSNSFNAMNIKLKALFNELSLQKEEFRSIISSLKEGLLVLDKDGRVILYNESFKNVVSLDPYKKFYWEILREPIIVNSVKIAIKEKKHITFETAIGNKSYLCSFSFIPKSEELIIVLHDITKFKKLEKMKKDLVANVSHELRTPLTAIKGYLETMEEGVEGDTKYYLEIAQKHTERLINIVNDLLLLSKLEIKGFKKESEDINLKDMVENVFKIFRQRANQKNIKLILKTNDSIIFIGDPFKLEQMFINLIDNAIKYTEKGEVAVLIQKGDREIIIEVRDTGIGIPLKHLDRIFERFYVVDKSHSRKLGGTGLGLSIVKHIVLLHNGTIKVKSSQGIGTIFTISFPLMSEQS